MALAKANRLEALYKHCGVIFGGGFFGGLQNQKPVLVFRELKPKFAIRCQVFQVQELCTEASPCRVWLKTPTANSREKSVERARSVRCAV